MLARRLGRAMAAPAATPSGVPGMLRGAMAGRAMTRSAPQMPASPGTAMSAPQRMAKATPDATAEMGIGDFMRRQGGGVPADKIVPPPPGTQVRSALDQIRAPQPIGNAAMPRGGPVMSPELLANVERIRSAPPVTDPAAVQTIMAGSGRGSGMLGQRAGAVGGALAAAPRAAAPAPNPGAADVAAYERAWESTGA